MKIEVHLHTTLRQESEENKGQVIHLELPSGSTIRDLLEILRIDLDPAHLLFIQNGKTADLNQDIEDGDVISIMTAISGG